MTCHVTSHEGGRLTNSKLSPQPERLRVATVWGSFRNPSDPWGSGPRGFAERSRCTNEFLISLLLAMQLASWVAAVSERAREWRELVRIL